MFNCHSIFSPLNVRHTPETRTHPKGLDSNLSRHLTHTGQLLSEGDERQPFRLRHPFPIISTSIHGVPLELPSFGSVPPYPPWEGRGGLDATQPPLARRPTISTVHSPQMPTPSDWFSDQPSLSQTSVGRNDIPIGTFPDQSSPTPLPQAQSIPSQGSNTARCKPQVLCS